MAILQVASGVYNESIRTLARSGQRQHASTPALQHPRPKRDQPGKNAGAYQEERGTCITFR